MLAASKSVNIAWVCLQSIGLGRLGGEAKTELEVQRAIHILMRQESKSNSKMKKFLKRRLKRRQKEVGRFKNLHFLRLSGIWGKNSKQEPDHERP